MRDIWRCHSSSSRESHRLRAQPTCMHVESQTSPVPEAGCKNGPRHAKRAIQGIKLGNKERGGVPQTESGSWKSDRRWVVEAWVRPRKRRREAIPAARALIPGVCGRRSWSQAASSKPSTIHQRTALHPRTALEQYSSSHTAPRKSLHRPSLCACSAPALRASDLVQRRKRSHTRPR
jgi:hypothetical protein